MITIPNYVIVSVVLFLAGTVAGKLSTISKVNKKGLDNVLKVIKREKDRSLLSINTIRSRMRR